MLFTFPMAAVSRSGRSARTTRTPHHGLRQLSEESIRKRFLAAKPKFSRAELRYLTEVDGVNHIALVAVLEADPDQLVAVARCVRLPDRPGTAEMAIVVGDPWQDQGLGTAITHALADAALAAGIRRFAATMLGDNEAARRLMRTFVRRLDEGTRPGACARCSSSLRRR